MITRKEFYIFISVIVILLGWLIFYNPNDINDSDGNIAHIKVRDSIMEVQRDSAFARALKFELMADSIQAVANRKQLDINIIRKKYEIEKKNVLLLSADSTLSLFIRSVTTP